MTPRAQQDYDRRLTQALYTPPKAAEELILMLTRYGPRMRSSSSESDGRYRSSAS